MSNSTVQRPVPGVTLGEFAKTIGCHFTTASRIKDGSRMPGRLMFDKIIKQYDLDPLEALTKFCGDKETFGRYMRENIFGLTDEDLRADKEKHGR